MHWAWKAGRAGPRNSGNEQVTRERQMSSKPSEFVDLWRFMTHLESHQLLFCGYLIWKDRCQVIVRSCFVVLTNADLPVDEQICGEGHKYVI